MPYGRGGAGNFEQAQADGKRVAEDVEAQEKPAVSSSASDQPTSSSSQDTYAHTGRGGAGNWFSPTEQQITGTYTKDSSAAATSAPAATRNPPTNFGGRGGAGNYNWENVEAEERRKAEKEWTEKDKEEGLRRRVEEDVESGLMKPGQAHLKVEVWEQGELEALGR